MANEFLPYDPIRDTQACAEWIVKTLRDYDMRDTPKLASIAERAQDAVDFIRKTGYAGANLRESVQCMALHVARVIK